MNRFKVVLTAATLFGPSWALGPAARAQPLLHEQPVSPIIYETLNSAFDVREEPGTVAESTEPGWSETDPTDPLEDPASLAIMTRLNSTFLLNFLHHVNVLEIIQANEALRWLSDPQARAFAETMIAQHQQAEQQGIELAYSKDLPIYVFQPSTVDIAIASELQHFSGANYDRAYLLLQLNQHEKALQDLLLLQDQLTDPDFQKLISQTVHVVQEHVNMANSALKGLPSSNSENPDSGGGGGDGGQPPEPVGETPS